MLGVLICALAILLPLGTSGPIVTPEGIAQTYGIEALFGREAEFGIEPNSKGPEHKSSPPKPTAQLGLLQPLQEAVVLDHETPALKKIHGSQGGIISLQGTVGVPKLHSFVNYDSQGLPNIPRNHGSQPHDRSVSPGTEKFHGSISPYNPHGSHLSKRIHGSHGSYSPYKPQSFSPSSFGSSGLPGSFKPHIHHDATRVVLIRKGRQADPAPSRSEALLHGIISDIRKDFLNPEGIRSFNPQPSKRVITFSDPDTPSRSDGLLSGIISGIKKDIFVGGDPRSSPSPPLASPPSAPAPSVSLSSSASPTSSPLPTSLSPFQSSSPTSSTSFSPPPPSLSTTITPLSHVISPLPSTPPELFSNSTLSPLLSSSPIQSPVTTSLAPTPPSTTPLVSPLPSPPATPLSSSSSDNEERHFPERSMNLLRGILSGIRSDIFPSSPSNFRNSGGTPQDTIGEERKISETINEILI